MAQPRRESPLLPCGQAARDRGVRSWAGQPRRASLPLWQTELEAGRAPLPEKPIQLRRTCDACVDSDTTFHSYITAHPERCRSSVSE